MKKIIIFIISLFVFFSCEEKKTEFIQSKVMDNKFLLKNYPQDDFLIKTLIKEFLLKNHLKNQKNDLLIFYKYTSDTEYFIDHLPDSGGFSSRSLEDIEDQEIAFFSISKCKNDTTKLVGKFLYYGINHNLIETDTIIYKCN